MQFATSILFWILAMLAIALPVGLFVEQVDRKKLLLIYFAAILVTFLKHELVLIMPQWADFPPDMKTYMMHGEAIYLHWMGEPVDPFKYKLSGYLNDWVDVYGFKWPPNSTIAYAGVIGTYEWIYACFLAAHHFFGMHWTEFATASNVAIASLLPIVCWLLAVQLGFEKRVAYVAAAMMMLDFGTSISASWLLKDMLAIYLSCLSMLGVVKLLQKGQLSLSLILLTVFCISLLSAVRFVGYLAILGAVGAMMVISFNSISYYTKKRLLVFLFAPIVLNSVLSLVPWNSENVSIFAYQLGSRFGAAIKTTNARQSDAAFDSNVTQWREDFKNKPFTALFKAAARTMFAPYPWGFLKEPLTWVKGVELYFFTSFFWFFCVPPLLYGIYMLVQRFYPADQFVLIVLAALAFAYIFMLGEWSTRQRAYMNPIFFVLASVGLNQVLIYLKKKRVDSVA